MNALLSVYNKDGVLDLARFLVSEGFSIISSGGTCQYLKDNGIEVRTVEAVTESPEILDGRVKTLHPRIHGGILARRDDQAHMETLETMAIGTIDLVCVNLYPFREKQKEGLSFPEMIEFIDIGGPSMLRSAAKNHAGVFVLSDPAQYGEFMEKYLSGSDLTAYRRQLALQVFSQTAEYDRAIADWLSRPAAPEAAATEAAYSAEVTSGTADVGRRFPEELTVKLIKEKDLRYGENPHQKSSFYRIEGQSGFMTTFQQLSGKPMGYINYKDLESAWRIVAGFDEPCCAAVKHNTPCGVALGENARAAYEKAYECDSLSIFGGIVAVNREIDAACAEQMTETMLHIVCAPSYSGEALEILKRKKNLIVIEMKDKPADNWSFISSEGGILLQEEDRQLYSELITVTERKPSEEELAELLFAMNVVKFVKSNAIVVTEGRQALGIGGGFVNRVDAARYALERGRGAHCMASDAFFPFSDVVEAAHVSGVTAIIQPGGSVNDQLSIDRCNELGIAMVFTGIRHFRH